MAKYWRHPLLGNGKSPVDAALTKRTAGSAYPAIAVDAAFETATASVNGSVSLVGLSVTSAASSIVALGAGIAVISGVQSNLISGVLSCKGDAGITFSGAGLASSSGIISASGGTSVNGTVTLSGASVLAGAGAVLSTGAASSAFVGVAAAGSVGSVVAAGGALLVLAGASAASAAGSVAAKGDANTAFSGAAATSGVGIISASGGTSVNGTASLAGASVAVGVGALVAAGAAQAVVTGASVLASSGAIAARGNAAGALQGAALIGTAGVVEADGGGFVISNARARLIYQLALLHGLDVSNPLTVSASGRSAGGLSQVVSGTDTVTITTSAAPAYSGDLDTWIDGLAALHGLTVPVVVTAASRSAGAISQAISTNSGITTVVRQ